MVFVYRRSQQVATTIKGPPPELRGGSSSPRLLVNGAHMLDQHRKPIQAHGGSILQHGGIYYWYGEDRSGPTYVLIDVDPSRYNPPRTDVVGVRCYSSADLVSWKDEGLMLGAGDHPDLAPSRVLERPRVLYNERHRQFVMWMHIDDAHYEEARAGVAWAESPTGPFHYLGSMRPHGEMSRDLTLFQDDEGSAYLIYASEENQVLHISQLSEDYLGLQPGFTRALEGLAREAPAAFKHQGAYFLLTSGCTGWAPNPAEVFMAPGIHGPWRSLGDPCRDADPGTCETFFGAQGTSVLPAPGRQGVQGHFLVLADHWSEEDLGASGYAWLPLWVEGLEGRRTEGGLEAGGSTAIVRWFDNWDLQSAFDPN